MSTQRQRGSVGGTVEPGGSTKPAPTGTSGTTGQVSGR
ncbi:MAG: hypothetical protein V7607_3231 [Solirubrobacteraceae bacterium]